MQQNSRLCDDREETINHMISECRKLMQKEYKTRHDWVGKVIHWELCKQMKFDHTDRWYMYNSESTLEYEIQTDNLISAWRPNLVIVNKKKKKKEKKKKRKEKKIFWIVDFAVPVDHRVKSKGEKRDNTWILLESWKNYGSRRWWWYQLLLVHFERSPNDW